MKILIFLKQHNPIEHLISFIKARKTPVTRQIFLLAFAISIFPIVILSSYLIRSIHTNENNKAVSFSSQVMGLVNNELEMVLEEQSSILTLLANQYSVFLEKESLSSDEFSKKLESIAQSKPYIENAYIKLNEDVPLLYFTKNPNPKFEKFDIMIDYLHKESSQSKTAIISEPHKDKGTKQTIITLSSPLISSKNTSLGTLFVDIGMDNLSTFLIDYIASLGMPDYLNTLIYLDGGAIITTTFPYEQNHLRDIEGGAAILNEQSPSFTHMLGDTEYMFFRGERKNGLNIISYIATDQINQAMTNALNPIIILLGIVISISLLFALAYTYLFVRPLHHIIRIIEHIKNKDLTHTIDTKKIKVKEFFAIANAINDLSKHLSHTLTAFQNASYTLLSSCEDVSSHIATTHTTYEYTTSITAQMHEGSTYQNTQLDKVRTSCSRVKEQLNDLTLLQKATSESSAHMQQSADVGNSTLFNLKTSITSTTQTLQGVSSRVKLLLNHLLEIDSMSHSITDIAKKTNLLALNASIEASRGGGHGGFAIIAQEIQTLADSSSDFAKQIATLTKLTTQTIKQLVNEVEETHHTQNNTVKEVTHTEESFSLIFKAILSVDENMKKMHEHFSSIISSNNNIFNEIEEISSTAQKNYIHANHINDSTSKQVAMLQEIRSATSLLGNMAGELSHLHSEYKLEN